MHDTELKKKKRKTQFKKIQYAHVYCLFFFLSGTNFLCLPRTKPSWTQNYMLAYCSTAKFSIAVHSILNWSLSKYLFRLKVLKNLPLKWPLKTGLTEGISSASWMTVIFNSYWGRTLLGPHYRGCSPLCRKPTAVRTIAPDKPGRALNTVEKKEVWQP